MNDVPDYVLKTRTHMFPLPSGENNTIAHWGIIETIDRFTSMSNNLIATVADRGTADQHASRLEAEFGYEECEVADDHEAATSYSRKFRVAELALAGTYIVMSRFDSFDFVDESGK